jgi:hypothetical protein
VRIAGEFGGGPGPGLPPGTGCLSPEVEVVLDVGLEAVEPDGGRPD